MSSGITPADIEAKFGTPAGVTAFPNFCNAVIVAAGPAVSSLPSLSERPGPDGGKDGEWLLTDDDAIARSPFTSVGWNVFQFKASGLGAKGRDAAISELNRKLDGAVRKLVDRHERGRVPAHYTAFTNLQLDLETPMVTATRSRISTHIERLKESILRGAPPDVRVTVLHAGTLAALVNAHPALMLAFFSENVGLSWEEKWMVEQNVWPFASAIPFIDREEEMRRIKEWLADASVRVIALTGPSGMGKTRLALEVTRDRASQAVVIERADRFEESVLMAMASANRETILLIEDPSGEQAEQIAKQAVAAARVKVILTILTKQDAPELRLLGHPAIQTISLERLNNDSAGKLLDAAQAHFDSRAREWIILQAGGIPAILLAAAEAGAELRENAGKLRSQLSRRFSQKVESKLGTDGVEALKILSPLQWVDLGQDSSQLKLLLQTQQSHLTEGGIRRLLPDLEAMGYLRGKGKFVTVVPPLFAASLARDLFEQTPRVARELFAGLNSAGRERLLERMITLELNEDASLWEYFFGAEGPFATPLQIIENLSLLNFLGRAAPRQTVRFLRVHFRTIVSNILSLEGQRESGELRAVLGELLEQPETSRDALDFFKLLAVGEITRGGQGRATAQFCECFVHWYPFPVSYAARADMVRALLSSSDPSERELGARAIVVATKPPHSLSGRSVHARRLGPQPTPQLWRDVWQFLECMIELRLGLCESPESPIAEIAKKDLMASFESLDRDLPIARLLPLLERAVQIHLKRKLGSNDRDAYSVLHSLRFRWAKSRDEAGQESHANEWADALAHLDRLIAHFDKAPFARRLKVAVGRALAHDYEEIEGERLYGYQKRLRALAAEAIDDPKLMTEDAWSALYDAEAYNATEFAAALGDLDDAQVFASGFEQRAVDWLTSRLLALYLAKRRKKNPSWVERRIDELILRTDFPRVAVLQLLKVIGPTPENVRRLFDLIRAKAITPLEVAQTFSTGKWLDDLPPKDVAVVFGYIATDENIAPWLAEALSLYLHHAKPLPRPLFDVAQHVLISKSAQWDARNNYELDQIALGLAKTDLHAGLQLLAQQIARLGRDHNIPRRDQWNPFEGYGERAFWEYLRDQAPEEAYQILGSFRSLVTWMGFRSIYHRELLDLANHRAILTKIATENRTAALVFISAMSVKQRGFFDFAYALLDIYPSDSEIQMRLNAATVERAPFGSDLDRLDHALKRVNEELGSEGLSERAASWLRELRDYIIEQRREYGKYFGSHEFLGWD